MSLLFSLHDLEISMGSRNLFEGLSFGVFEGEKVGLIGPNGAGKSTLLKLIAQKEVPDQGEIRLKKNLRLAFVEQTTRFERSESLLERVTEEILRAQALSSHEAEVRASMYLSRAGFTDLGADLSKLSGGWKKRAALVMALAIEPELLILDEPTNHMDWEGILWLEDQLKNLRASLLLVSHDRAFLDALTHRTIEINRLYRDGYLSFDCGYRDFLEKKDEYIRMQSALEGSLSNKARREVEWLRAGVKARTTKSTARMKEAYELLEDLEKVKERNRSAQSRSRVEIDATERRSKKLIELKRLRVGFEDKVLIDGLNMVFGPRSCLGLLGRNGSGKSSLLKVVTGELPPLAGEVFRAEKLKTVYFEQNRQSLPQDISLLQYLGEGGDYVIFKDQSVHVASYASRFLFSSDKMQLKISQLSGGEQARLLIAKLLLQPADVLILDEPTNDLDIETIEVLEETLAAFDGLLILVSHDRYFLSELCQKYLALRGDGGWTVYADIDQWLRDFKKEEAASATAVSAAAKTEKPEPAKPAPKAPMKAKLSYKEKLQLERMESDIEAAESALSEAQAELEKPEVRSNHQRLNELSLLVAERQKRVDDLYELWTKLEEKLA
jgi:ATP-binding cassette subfamily F protein uup